MHKDKILIVDDEADLREILQYNLEAAGFETDTASSAEEALSMLSADHKLILLDVMMGGMSGFRMAEVLRNERHNSIPIIFLTAKDTENDLLAGFSAGGDDYISKPFSLQEVLARVRAVLRRTATNVPDEEDELRFDNLVIDNLRKVVRLDGEDICLSPKEFGILHTLASRPGRVFSREEILDRVWQGEAYVLDRTIDVHIARVRRKLGQNASRIKGRQGYGYSFE